MKAKSPKEITMTNLETILHSNWADRPLPKHRLAQQAIAAPSAANDFLVSLSFCMLSIAAFMIVIM